MNLLKKNLVRESKFKTLPYMCGKEKDVRIITKKVFDFGDQNEATSGFKILGAIVAIVGGLIILFC